MQTELTGICCFRKRHAVSIHADARSVSEWQSPSQPWVRQKKELESRKIAKHAT